MKCQTCPSESKKLVEIEGMSLSHGISNFWVCAQCAAEQTMLKGDGIAIIATGRFRSD